MSEMDALFALSGPVEELQYDVEFLEHLAVRATYRKHQVSVSEIEEVHGGTAKYFANSGSGRAPIIMVGPTSEGRWLCVPIEPTGRFGLWRPVTAFEANTHHKVRYQGD